LYIKNHGWKYAFHSKPLNIKSYWDKNLRLGVCADWFIGPRLESGWLSAKDLSLRIKK
jgi:predicted NAD/FAD-dependent oxidoreductase